MRRRATGRSLICECRFYCSREGGSQRWLAPESLPLLSIPGLRNHFSQSWRIYAKNSDKPAPERQSSPCRDSKLRLEKNVKATRSLKNDEIRMTKLEGITNDQMTNDRNLAFSSFRLWTSFVICHSPAKPKRRGGWCFVISSALILMLMAQITHAESPSLIGKWNVEITFANEEHRSVRFEAQSDGKGTLTPADPQSKAWGAAKPSDAKWTRGDENSVTFSGPVEFLIGNVGRDAGTLTCKGKLETADLITGEVEFPPLAGERPSKHGSFKAVRASQ